MICRSCKNGGWFTVEDERLVKSDMTPARQGFYLLAETFVRDEIW